MFVHNLNAKEEIAKVGGIIAKKAQSNILNYRCFCIDILNQCLDECTRKFNNIQPEILIPYMANKLTAWCSYILEAKNICHYRKTGIETNYKSARDMYIVTLKQLILDARNQALDEKRKKQVEGDSVGDYDVPQNIKIPPNYSEDNLLSVSF